MSEWMLWHVFGTFLAPAVDMLVIPDDLFRTFWHLQSTEPIRSRLGASCVQKMSGADRQNHQRIDIDHS